MLGGNAFRSSPRRVLLALRGGPGADPSPGHAKSAKSGLDLVWIWVFFGYILRQLWRCFYVFFVERSFSAPG